MQKLNELVELANLANIAGQGTPQMADFRVTASPDNILAIAEAFSALEQGKCGAALLEREEHHAAVVGELIRRNEELQQRAEAAESGIAAVRAQRDKLRDRLKSAEAKLEELEKQEPVAYRWEGKSTGNICYDGMKPLGVMSYPLYARPAPAVSLAELLPEEPTGEMQVNGAHAIRFDTTAMNKIYTANAVYRAMRAVLLRNIEEANK